MSYTGSFTAEQVKEIEMVRIDTVDGVDMVTVEEVDKQWAMFPDENFDTAVGAVIALKKGMGQERNKPFQTQAEADADVSSEDSKLTGNVGTTD